MMPTSSSSALGKFIRSRRTELGYSIRELAGMIKRSPTFVVLLETEASPPSTTDEMLVALSKALKTPENRLFALVHKLPKSALPRSEHDVALFRRVQRLSVADKTKLLDRLRKQQDNE